MKFYFGVYFELVTCMQCLRKRMSQFQVRYLQQLMKKEKNHKYYFYWKYIDQQSQRSLIPNERQIIMK